MHDKVLFTEIHVFINPVFFSGPVSILSYMLSTSAIYTLLLFSASEL